MSVNLSIGHTFNFANTFNVGDTITIHSDAIDLTPHAKGLDNTVLDILAANNDHLVHLSFRRKIKSLHLNSKKGSRWFTGETLPYEDFVQAGKPLTILVAEHEDTFNIYLNGRLFREYKKLIRSPVIRFGYYMEPGQTAPMLGQTITVSAAASGNPPSNKNYQEEYFQVTPSQVEKESEADPFDIVVVGSGIGGGVLATALLEKNDKVTDSDFTFQSTPGDVPKTSWKVSRPSESANQPPKPLRILVVEKGGLVFHTHCINGPRPTKGTTSRGSGLFYQRFKEPVDMDAESAKIWSGGPVFCLGGRSAVWGLFSPRIGIDTLHEQFPSEVKDALLDSYYRKAEKLLQVAYPSTLAPHQALIDRLNLCLNPELPKTQWQWGRISSQFDAGKNFTYAAGAYSPIDTLVEAAMNDPKGNHDLNFRTVLKAPCVRLEPVPTPGQKVDVSHVIIRDGDIERKIACKHAVVSAGSVESAAILLRSVSGDLGKFDGSGDFKRNFGHITDHRIFAVSMPFFYVNMADRDLIGGMKLQTEIQFCVKKGGDIVDNSTAMASISLDTASFLPRADVSNGLLPMLVISFMIPSDLSLDNKVELNNKSEPKLHYTWAEDKYLDDKKGVMADFAVDVMNKIVKVLNVRFALKTADGYEPILHDIALKDITLNQAGAGAVGHELGTIPMPNSKGYGGIVDSDLQMKYGWNNVSVCDLSVLPYSAAANPTLTLAALSLRLADKLYPTPDYSPVTVYNLTGSSVTINITDSNQDKQSFGPVMPLEVASGSNQTWKIAQNETMSVYSCKCAESYDVQMVYPGVSAMIVTTPPKAKNCSCGGSE